jgi:hypothetical protein
MKTKGYAVFLRGLLFYCHASSEKVWDALHSLDDLFIWFYMICATYQKRLCSQSDNCAIITLSEEWNSAGSRNAAMPFSDKLTLRTKEFLWLTN